MIRILKILNIIGMCVFGYGLGVALTGKKFYLPNFEYTIFAIIGVVYASINYLYFEKADDKKEDFFFTLVSSKNKETKERIKRFR